MKLPPIPSRGHGQSPVTATLDKRHQPQTDSKAARIALGKLPALGHGIRKRQSSGVVLGASTVRQK